MKRLVLLSLICCVTTAVAGPRDPTPSEMAGYIGTAQREVLLAAPVLRVRMVAEALRVAMNERGVTVKLLTGVRSANDAGSYWWGLSAAGATLRGVGVVSGFEVVIDRRLRLTGDAIGRALEPDERVTVRLERGSGVETHARAWKRLWARAKPLKGVLK